MMLLIRSIGSIETVQQLSVWSGLPGKSLLAFKLLKNFPTLRVFQVSTQPIWITLWSEACTLLYAAVENINPFRYIKIFHTFLDGFLGSDITAVWDKAKKTGAEFILHNENPAEEVQPRTL